jgi:diacylglycerol kinase (ATP)
MSAAPVKRLVVAINPTASFGRGSETGSAVVRALREAGHDVTQLTEPSFAELRDVAAHALAAGTDALIVVGGDGMVSLGANLVAGTGTPLGIVPSGTGNDVSRGLGIPVGDPGSAIVHLLAALQLPPRVIDAGRVTRADGSVAWFAGVLSAGFDAIVNERANRMRRPRGPSRYTIAMVLELLRFRPISYRLVTDGESRGVRGMLVAIANGTSIGGGMKITPEASFDDGLLDVCVVGPLSKLRFIRLFPSVFTGAHVTNAAVSMQRGRRVRIEADAVVAYADGERIGPLPLDIELVPRALRVLAPAHPDL